ncbi:MAG: threonine aldolase family protein [Anaerocolumna sp.]
MYYFVNDYSEGAHPKILELMIKNNFEQNTGYGEDVHTTNAKEYMKKHLKTEEVDIHFIPGGTQTNLLAISSFLKPYQAVIAADTGHINVHETGAIEATGHKVIACHSKDGKLTPSMIQKVLDTHAGEHMVMPKMVYISNTTELGTVYSKEELSDIYDFCQEKDLLLYLDGARLASALTSVNNDLEISDLPELTDAFYIGGTKNGALLGEALVIVREDLRENFRYAIKQRGALMAKGFVTGIQFEGLFENDLYFELGNHANGLANKIATTLNNLKYTFLAQVGTNQLFPIVENKVLEVLEKEFAFSEQLKVNEDYTVIRLVTSWATTVESVEALCNFFTEQGESTFRESDL